MGEWGNQGVAVVTMYGPQLLNLCGDDVPWCYVMNPKCYVLLPRACFHDVLVPLCHRVHIYGHVYRLDQWPKTYHELMLLLLLPCLLTVVTDYV